MLLAVDIAKLPINFYSPSVFRHDSLTKLVSAQCQHPFLFLILPRGKYSEAQATVHKHPVSIALSKDVLRQIDQEASKQKRSRSDWIEMRFTALFSKD